MPALRNKSHSWPETVGVLLGLQPDLDPTGCLSQCGFCQECAAAAEAGS